MALPSTREHCGENGISPRNSMKQRAKDGMRAAGLMARLAGFAEAEPPTEDEYPLGKNDAGYIKAMSAYVKAQMTPAQVQAAQAVLKKLMPDLSSVEQTTVDDRDMMSEAQILDQMKLLIQSSPDIARQLRALLTPTAVPATDASVPEWARTANE